MSVSVRTRRALLACVLFALGAIIRPTGVVAQNAPMRWDGSLEYLSSTYSWPAPGSALPAGMSRHPLSADGRWLVYTVDLPNDPFPTYKQFFILDRLTGEPQQLMGAPGAAPPVISGDGYHAAVETCDPMWLYDQPGICDIYLLDLRNYTLEIASRLPGGVPGDGHSREPMVSRDGRYVVFRTESTTLVATGAEHGQIVLRDRDADGNGIYDEPGGVTIQPVSVSSSGEPGNGPSSSAQVSADGRIIVFRSAATNLVAGDTNDAVDVFLHDRRTGETRRINVGWDGQQATPTVDSPAISMTEDGRYVAFAADDSYLMNPVAPLVDDNGALDVHVYDRETGTLQRIEVGPYGTPGNGHTYWPTLSADGRYVSMVSSAANIEEPSTVTPGRAHVYVFDRVTQQITRVSRTPEGTEPDADAANAVITADGSFVTFVTIAGNLSPAASGVPAIFGAGHLNVTPLQVMLPSGGGEATLTVDAQQYVRWTMELSEYTWLQVSHPSFGIGPVSFKVHAQANPEPTPRSVSLRLGSQTVEIKQESGLRIMSLSPASGPETGGTLVTITGTGFQPDMMLYFDGVLASYEFVDATTVRATTPPHAPGLVSVWVTTNFRSAVYEGTFHYTDSTPPEVYVFVNGDQHPSGWYTSDVVIDWLVYDAQSTVVASPTCVQTIVRRDTNGTLYTCSATSEGGTTAREVYIQRDTTRPFVHIAAPRNTLYPLNSVQTSSPVCLDDGSGVASCVAPVPSGQPFDTSTTGYHTFTLQAVDNVGWHSITSTVYAVSNGECDPRPAEMIAWWPGDGDLRDVIGGFDGVPAQSHVPAYLPGVSRDAMYFRVGDGKGVHVGDAAALRLTTGMTLSAWISNWNGVPNQISVIAGKEGEYLLGRHYDGRIHYSLANASPGWGWVDTGVVAEWNVWTHLALTYDGNWVRLYKNGQPAYSREASGAIGDADPAQNDFVIGFRQAAQPGSEFGGTIDNVQVVGRAMLLDEIRHAFFSTPHGHCLEPSTLTFVPGSLRAGYGQASAEIVAQLTRNGVAQPGTPVHFTFRGTPVGATKTDASGAARVTVPLPEGLAVGTYPNAVEARVDEDLVLTASSVVADFTVVKATPTITWPEPAPIVYGMPLGGLQLNARANASGEFQYSPAFGSVLGAGTQTLSATFTPYDPNTYSTTTATVPLVVLKADPLIHLTGGTFTYDGTPKAAVGYVTGIESTGIESTSAGLGPLTFTYDGSAEPPVNAGTYTVVASFAGDANYNSASATTTLTIEKATPVVTVSGGTYAYDGLPHSATAAVRGVAGVALAPVTLTYNGSPHAPVQAGTYTVVATFAGDANHSAASSTATLTILKAAPRITAAGGTFAYDGLPHAATYSVSGLDGATLEPVSVLYAGSPNPPANAGTYPVVVSFDGDQNYAAAFAATSITILKASAEVIAVGGTFTYDGLPHAASGTVTGVGGVTLGPLTFTYDGSSSVPVDAGTYSVVATFPGDPNHNAATGSATLTIDRATPRLSVNGGTFTYDGTPHAASGTAFGLDGATLAALTFTYNGTADVPVNAGTYEVVGSFAGDPNYAAATATASLVIVKAASVVSATGGTFVYDGAPHAAAGTATGVGGVTLGPVTFTYNGAGEPPVDAGSYEVVAAFAGDANHEASSATATLTIEKATAIVTVADSAFTYDGLPHPASGSVRDAAGAEIGTLTFTYNGSAAAPVNAGEYAVVGTFAGSTNYASASGTATIIVAKASPVIDWAAPGAIVYGTPLGAAQLNATASIDGTFSYSPSAGTVLAAGASQPLSVTFTPADTENYTSASRANAITVVPAPLVVRADDAMKRFGMPLPDFTGSVSGFVNGDSLASLTGTLVFATTATAQSPAGVYPIVPSGVSSANYSITFVNGTLTVVRGAVTVAIMTSPSPSGYDQPMTFTAAVGPTDQVGVTPRGTVSFFDGTTLLGSAVLNAGMASLSTAGLATGSRTIEARFSGDGSFEPGSASASHVILAAGATPTVTVSSSRNPSNVGQSVTLTAEVRYAEGGSIVSGSVHFYAGATLLGTATLHDGRAALTVTAFAAGSHAITARYLGTGDVPPVRSRVMVQAVGDSGWRERSTTMTLSSSAAPSRLGEPVVFTATVSTYNLTGWMTAPPSGRILIMVNGEVVGDPAGVAMTAMSATSARVTVTLDLPHGNHAVSATYLGDLTFKGSTAQLTQVVN